MRRYIKNILGMTAILAVIAPSLIYAATPAAKFTYGGWLPYWREDSGTAETAANLSKLDYFSPFSYEVDPEVGVMDVMVVNEAPWPALFAAARAKGVKIVPSVAYFDADGLQAILSDPVKRYNHEQDILGTVLMNNYDGIDIDYENKHAETKTYYSAFIKELSAILHKEKKVLSCTVEPRTPMKDRFAVTRPPVEYANDYAVLNKYCDEVRIMAYDQGNIDIRLNKSKGTNRPYFPVADPDWVEKVIKEALQSISAKKLVLGIPTYGYEFQMGGAELVQQATSTGSQMFTLPTSGWQRVRAINFQGAMQIASSIGVKPVRNSAGELSFAYATTSPSTGQVVARIAWFSDAQSIAQKIALAKKYKLKGVYLFKFDGEADQAFWNLLSIIKR